jgi:hypothetical protein
LELLHLSPFEISLLSLWQFGNGLTMTTGIPPAIAALPFCFRRELY